MGIFIFLPGIVGIQWVREKVAGSIGGQTDCTVRARAGQKSVGLGRPI